MQSPDGSPPSSAEDGTSTSGPYPTSGDDEAGTAANTDNVESADSDAAAPGSSDNAGPAGTSGGLGGFPARMRAAVDRDPALAGVLAITVVGLFARLLWLGARSAHFDEARVAYFTLRFFRSGHFEYRRIIHGPFIQHVNTWVWSVLPLTDFSMRLVVAIVGASLPLVVLLFREHLRDRELVLAALFLGFNPILLYYSRFLRSDLLVATFMVAALGFFVRFLDTRRFRYVHASAAFVALGFASKENAVVYLLCYLGAAALVVDTGLFRPREHDSGWDVLGAWYGRAKDWFTDDPVGARRTAGRYAGHAAGALAIFGLLTLFFYAPRTGTVGGPVGLYQAVGSPSLLPDLIQTTAADIAAGFETWFGSSRDLGCHKDSLVDAYGCFLYRFLATMAAYAAPLSVFAVAGFLRERYTTGSSRWLVMFASYWGFVSVLGYPLATDIWAAWVVVHALVPLAIPAAVGLSTFVDWGAESWAARDVADAALPTALVLLTVTGMLWTGAMAAYAQPQSRTSPTDIVQFAQPSSDLSPGVAAIERAIRGNGGVDVVWYGDRYDVADESAADVGPAPGTWYPRLPLPWYLEAMDAQVESASSVEGFDSLAASDPPVLIVQQAHVSALDGRLDGYRRVGSYDLRANIGGPQEYTSVVVFVAED